MIPLPPPVTSGIPTAAASSPNYVDLNARETTQQLSNTQLAQGSIQNPGVILSKHGEDVPLEFSFGIRHEFTHAPRPTLMPLFRTRYVDKPGQGYSSTSEYEEIRQNLPEPLRMALENDEQLPLKQRDLEILAFDHGLRFEAMKRALKKYISGPVVDTDRSLASKENYQSMPGDIKRNLLGYSEEVIRALESYLEMIGPNDPSYDMFLNALNQMKGANSYLGEVA
ncbi:MAG: hypothetical protein H0W88_04080 [Parachlamydiaceae bacterium]|nr:hypothetical protein [Parachlamydiaceae bacterium]